MPSPKAIRILSKFRKKEWVEFVGFSSIHASLAVKKLVLSLTKAEVDKLPSREKLAARHPELMKNPDKVLTALLKYAELFISNRLRSESLGILSTEKLLAFYIERGLIDEANSLVKNSESYIIDFKPVSSQEHLALFEYYENTAINERIIDGRDVFTNPEMYEQHLDAFYWIEKLKRGCERVNRSILHKNYPKLPASEITLLLDNSAYYAHQARLIHVYREILSLLIAEIPEPLQLSNLFSELHQIEMREAARGDVLTLSHYLINLSLRGMPVDENLYGSFLLDLLSFMDSNGLLRESGVVSAPVFKLAISVGLKLARFDWVQSIYEKYHNDLPHYGISNYFQALIFHYRGQNAQARRLLYSIDTSRIDEYLKLNVRILDIRIYIEDSQGDVSKQIIDSKLKGVKSVLRSYENIGIGKFEAIMRFAEIVRTLVLKDISPVSYKKLLLSINDENAVPAEKQWLLRILEIRAGNLASL